jgi:FixJ family two-component response regulator
MMMKANAMIFLVDDDASVRKGLARLMSSAGYACESFESAESFLQRERHAGPACLVLDMQMPQVTGIELQERLERLGCHLPVIFLTGHGTIPQTVQALKQGALNFFSKPVDDEVLLESIKEALACSEQWLAAAQAKAAVLQRIKLLTAREFEVMQLVITGVLNKQIAAHLGISLRTVKTHRGQVMAKMSIPSVAELVRHCETAGIKPLAVL